MFKKCIRGAYERSWKESCQVEVWPRVKKRKERKVMWNIVDPSANLRNVQQDCQGELKPKLSIKVSCTPKNEPALVFLPHLVTGGE